MKHFLFKFILVVLGLVISANLRADENTVLIDGIYYNLTTETKTATVTKEHDFSYSGAVVIPPSVTYGGVTYTVTTIGSHAFDWCSNVESVIIPNTVTEIKNYAFQN